MTILEPRSATATSDESFMIRCARPDDAANLLDYIRSVAEETGFFVIHPDEFPSTEEQERQWIQEHLDRSGKVGPGRRGGRCHRRLPELRERSSSDARLTPESSASQFARSGETRESVRR